MQFNISTNFMNKSNFISVYTLLYAHIQVHTYTGIYTHMYMYTPTQAVTNNCSCGELNFLRKFTLDKHSRESGIEM